MDRRQQKTRKAIFNAFTHLLEKKHFNHITVQEIIDEANIGRSTFYAHFESKDDLLKEMCTEIFEHVFSTHLNSESSHDFSHSSHTLQDTLTHLVYHLKDNNGNILEMLSGESGELFQRYFQFYLREIFQNYPELFISEIPEQFIVDYLVNSFWGALLYWISNHLQESPEVLVSYYLKAIHYNKTN